MSALTIAVFILIAGYLSLVLIVGRLFVFGDVIPRRRVDPDLVARYDHDTLEFRGSGRPTLRGWLIRSDCNPTNKTVVMLHSWSRNRARKMGHIELFLGAGFHVLTYDQRSHGESDTGRQTFGVEESRDLDFVLSSIEARSDINMHELVAVGFSLGSGGLIYAAARKRWFRAIVVEGAFANSYDSGKFMLQRRLGKSIGYIIGISVLSLGSWVWSLGKFKHSSPADVVADVSPTPIFFIYNKNDHMVPIQSAERLILAAGEPKEVWITTNGQHTRAYENYPEEYSDRVVGFFVKYTIGKRTHETA